MYFLWILFVSVPLLAIIALMTSDHGRALKKFIQFVITGLDSGFSLTQILFLNKIGKASNLDDRTSLFWSVPVLDRCIAEIVRRSKDSGTDTQHSTQEILGQLYDYRTRIELEKVQKKRGLESSRDISVNQKLRILLRGTGVFSSRVMRNGPRGLVVDLPTNPSIAGTSIDWPGRDVSVYFWRHDDAGYVFDTTVLHDPGLQGKAVLTLSHSYNLIRSQKRRSIRVKCSISGQMYLLKPEQSFDTMLEPEPGMKCLVEDLSEDGAMVLIGGKAAKGIRVKLQFMVHQVLIVMAGTVKGVEYKSETNQSRMHFESIELNPRMRNAILTFVYNVLPEEQKEELDAIRLSEEDGLVETESGEDTEHTLDELGDIQDVPDFLSDKE